MIAASGALGTRRRVAEIQRAVFPAALLAPRDARRLVQDTLRGEGFDGGATQAALLTSELATNAVVHAREPFTIAVHVQGRRARVEVCDPNDRLPVLRDDDLAVPGGQGLRIVDAIADRWGIEPLGPNGKTVWFEISDA